MNECFDEVVEPKTLGWNEKGERRLFISVLPPQYARKDTSRRKKVGFGMQ